MMSCYERNLVVRYKPPEDWVKSCLDNISEKYDDLIDYLQEKYPDVFSESWADLGKISRSPTCELFLDLLLYRESNSYSSEFYKSRKLTMPEHYMAIKVFNRMNINPLYEDLRMVDFCWYNCSEANDFFEETDDEFYHSKEKLIMEVCNEINR